MTRTPRDKALAAVRTLLDWIDPEPWREGLVDTPERVLRAWEQDWGSGYREKAPSDLLRLFEGQRSEFPTRDDRATFSHAQYNQMVVVRDISMFSTCEHHMAPFFGEAHIAYIPSVLGIVGISKLARIVDYFSRRLQVQERLTEQIADFLETNLSGSCAVTLSATHLCMVSRGVRQPRAITVTTSVRGEFMNDPATRAEFLGMVRPK